RPLLDHQERGPASLGEREAVALALTPRPVAEQVDRVHAPPELGGAQSGESHQPVAAAPREGARRVGRPARRLADEQHLPHRLRSSTNSTNNTTAIITT